MNLAAMDRRASTRDRLAQVRHYQVHGVGLRVRADDPRSLEPLERSYGAFRVQPDAPETAPPIVTISIHDEGGRIAIDAGHATIRVPAAERHVAVLDAILVHLLAGLHRSGILAIHAGAVAIGDRAVLIAGPSGAGKSTQVAALLRHATGFATDELALIAPDDRTVLPYPRALHVGPATRALVRVVRVVAGRPTFDLGGGHEWAAGPNDLQAAFGVPIAPPTPLGAIVLLEGPPDRRPDPVASPISPAIAAMELMRGTPAGAVEPSVVRMRLARITPTVPCFSIRPGAPAATARAIVRLLEPDA
jgi:hypothetical protein